MGILFVVFAALLAATSNLCMRRSIDAGGSSRIYLVVQLTFSFFVMILLNPVRAHDFGWNGTVVALGLFGGLMLGVLMWGIGKALETGPPGLSIAILNASSIMPAIAMALLFGMTFGHTYTLWNAVGSILVLFGIMWAGWTREKNQKQMLWAIFALLIFAVHTVYLIYLQWWAMILTPELPMTRFLPFHVDSSHIQWFMPAIFFVAALFQWFVFLTQERRRPSRAELSYGLMGGIANGGCAFFLILAPQVALQWEQAMIFPIFSVGTLLVCNLWAQAFYKERVNWKANTLCVTGLIVGTVMWSGVF